MKVTDLKEQEIINTNGEKENVIRYFSLEDIYITDKELNIGSPKNNEYFSNVEEAISNLFDRNAKNSPILKYKTDFVENIVHENIIVLDENTRKLYNDSENLDDFEKKVREKYYETNFRRKYVSPSSQISKLENKELYDKYIEAQIKQAENFINDLKNSDLNNKLEYDIFKKYYVYNTSEYMKKYLETNEVFKDLKAIFYSERVEFEKKNKPEGWSEKDQKKLEDLTTFLKENPEIKKGSAEYLNGKEKALYFSDEKEEYINKIMREIISVEDVGIYYNYKHLCDYINEEEEHYLEGIREEQDNFKKTPEFDDKIKEIYAYLIDNYGISTDISDRVKNITQEDLNRKRIFTMSADEYKQHFMLDISNEAAMEGSLVTNALYVICKGSAISEIEAPEARNIFCENCENLEKIEAPECTEVHCEGSPLLKEENIEVSYDCDIEGLEKKIGLKL